MLLNIINKNIILLNMLLKKMEERWFVMDILLQPSMVAIMVSLPDNLTKYAQLS